MLARHGTHAEVGQVLSGRSEIALSAAGHAEAAALARHLAGVPLATIHASPRRRTMETAAAVAQARGMDVQPAPALDEIDFGAFTGRSFAQLDADPAWQCWNAERATARCPNGETMAEAVSRAWTYLAALPAGDTPALCVTHCDVIRGMVAHLLGLDAGRMFSFDCDPGSLTIIAFDGDTARLVTLNERPALGPASERRPDAIVEAAK